MKHLVFAALAAAGLTIAAPASAISLIVDFPVLTYPEKPAPEATQNCVELTSVTGAACAIPAN
ncbi:hypothetical protein [Yoonia sp. SS1-5]|uniref:Porin n=1 Tax=Yoonia rhodophyticola TaxID=3137370 RepID=A0AAN0NLF8_9RHOB